MNITITINDHSFHGTLNGTDIAKGVADMIPIEQEVRTWGDEVYFSLPSASFVNEVPTMTVAAGDIAYWPPENALAIFYGPTPMSEDETPVPASEVTIIGTVEADPHEIKQTVAEASSPAVRISAEHG